MQENLKFFKENGFLYLPNFFSKESIENIRVEAKHIFTLQLIRLNFLKEIHSGNEFEEAMYAYFNADLNGFVNCGKQAQHLISLHKLSLSEKLVSYLKDLGLEMPIISTRPVLFFNSIKLAKKEIYWKTPPHQDWRSIQGSINSVVTWIPLIDINIELGTIEIVPKSHLEGLITEHIEDSFGVINRYNDNDFIPLEVQQGDIVIFSQFLVHRSGNNITNSIRWSCHFRYNDLNEQSFIERSFPHTYIYKVDDTLLNPNFNTKQELTIYLNENH